VPKGAMPQLQFSLPEGNLHMDVESEVAWADVKGRAGFRFHHVPKEAQQLLEKWLDDHMEQEFPGAKDRIAAAESESLS